MDRAPSVKADILLVTVNPFETQAVVDAFKPINNRFEPVLNFYRDFGRINGARVMLLVSGMGSGKVDGSHANVFDAIRELWPNTIIAVGIAFGADESKQRIGDILISEQLQPYELQKIAKKQNISRSNRPDASSYLVGVFRNAGLDWKKSSDIEVRPGLLLSGEKLVDNFKFRKKLLRQFPEAIGGEMEGAGVYVAVQRAMDRGHVPHPVHWIVVKAICDWGHDKSGELKDERQKLAARNAVEFVKFTIQRFRFPSVDADSLPISSTPPNLAEQPAADNAGPYVQQRSNEVLTPPLDLWTPGPNKIELMAHYEAIVGGEVAQQLWTLSRASISAVANGDFDKQIALGSDLERIAGSNAYLQGEAAYFAAEGLRLRADIEADAQRKADLRRQAMEGYRRANELLPNDPRPIRGIGRTLEVEGEYDQALRMFEMAKGLCVAGLSATDAVKRPDLAHELLRTARHLIHCLLDIRKTNPISRWHREHKERQIEGYLIECENYHRELMPIFRAEEPWWLIEWFMGLVFIAKAWGELGNLNRVRQTLIHALDARRRLLSGDGPLSAIEAANLKWWLAVARERRSAFDNRSYELIEQVTEAVERGDRKAVHRLVDGVLLPSIPPWGSIPGA